MKQITVNDRGVFLQTTVLLTIRQILKRRRIIENQILRLHEKIQNSQNLIKQREREICDLEEQRKGLYTPLVEAFILKQKQEENEIKQKAQNLLHELIGDELFEELTIHKRIIFTAKDGGTYKIESNGKIYRRSGKEWNQLCIIRPKDLPLPDFLLSLFVSIREHPTSYSLRHRWRR